MDRFVNRENVERYRELASELTNDTERLRILKLLAEERTKFKLEFAAGVRRSGDDGPSARHRDSVRA